MPFEPLDDDTLLAYIDGTLNSDRRAHIAALLESSPDLRSELVWLMRLQDGMRATFDAADGRGFRVEVNVPSDHAATYSMQPLWPFSE